MVVKTAMGPTITQFNPLAGTGATDPRQRGKSSMQKVRRYTGALADGYPNEWWNCSVCSQRNQADHFYCDGCRMRRLPLPGTVFNYNQKHNSGVLWALHPMNKVHNQDDDDSIALHRRHGQEEVYDEEEEDETAPNKVDVEWQTTAPKPPHQWFNLTEDTVQMVMSFFQGLSNMYKVLMGCFLVVFVNQQCEDSVGAPTECSMEDNFYNRETFHVVVQAVNAVAAFTTLVYLFSVKFREAELIASLDEDPSVTNDFLVRINDEKIQVFDFYPRIRDKITKLNRNVYLLSILTAGIYLANVVVSAVRIFGYTTSGTSTFFSFFGYISLNMSLLWKYCMTMRASYSTNIAYSLLKTDPSVFNSIDKN